ncbi:MAG: hypothetical protein EPO26_05505 [Chloroflexota bacterium]|nr:MAG: hypothetical protein EPO26_05505 [Chloroflexota bacterium]
MAVTRCSCGTLLKVFWLWPDEAEDGLMHVTDRLRDAPKNAEEVRAVSPTDAAIAFDQKHTPEHDITSASSTLRRGRCARRIAGR